jgi:monoamine oxidase
MSDEPLEVAIVGGGVSGVYSAWRLLTEGGKKRVAVFEASDRVGGRLLSVTPPNITDMVAELGGMRILPAVQPHIQKLIDELNNDSSTATRIELFDFPVDEDANIAYLRGIYLRLADFKNNPQKLPYSLSFLERGKSPGAIVLNAIEQIVPGITDPKLTEKQRRQMAQTAHFGGEPLYQQGFWELLLRVISGEAYQLAVAAGGYESTITNWNAADAIPWYLSDFGITPKYRGFKNGFQQVPLMLAEKVKQAGGTIHYQQPLNGFELTGNGVKLNFRSGESVNASALILAMPRRALEIITPGSPLLQSEEVVNLVKSVTPRPLFKLFTTYDYPWWLAAGVKEGRTTTDLPLRQTYYWPRNDGKPAAGGRAMLMASYDDGLNVGFWDGFRDKRGRGWRKEAENKPRPEYFQGESDEKSKEWDKYPAPAEMVEEVQRQLTVVHNLQFTPNVIAAAFKDWGDDPFGGGWNNWNIGVQSADVMRKILRPVEDAPVHICGEAYSNAQGWVEGALETADLMLKQYFGVNSLV